MTSALHRTVLVIDIPKCSGLIAAAINTGTELDVRSGPALCNDFDRTGTNRRTPEYRQPTILYGCSFEWYEVHHEKSFAYWFMNQMRSHDGSEDIEFTVATSIDRVGEITRACFSKRAGWDRARNTAGYAIRGYLNTAGYTIRGRLTRAVSWQPGSAGRWTLDSSMQQRLIVYIVSNDAMMTMNGNQAGIADVKNPEARINLSRDTVDTAIKGERSTYAEAACLRLGLCWSGA